MIVEGALEAGPQAVLSEASPARDGQGLHGFGVGDDDVHRDEHGAAPERVQPVATRDGPREEGPYSPKRVDRE